MRESVRVLIVDDHPIILSGIRDVIEREAGIKVVGEADNCESAVALARELLPDVILMDLNLPDKSGVEAIKEICAKNPETHILVLSNYSDEKLIFEAIEAGAIGYLLKVDATDKIVAAIMDAFEGKPTLSFKAERSLLSYMRSRQQNPDNPIKYLTEKEKRILRLLGEGLINPDIAERTNVSEGTVRTHISHILSKLNLQNRAQAVIFAIRNGLVDSFSDVDQDIYQGDEP